MIVKRITSPAGLPYMPGDVTDHLRIEDDQVTEGYRHMKAAAQEAEAYGQLALLTQTIRVTFEVWPVPHGLTLPLPIAPVIDPGSVTMTADGAPFTGFTVITGLRPALVLTGDCPSGRVVIEYDAGFGVDASAIPPAPAHAILDQASAFFDERGVGAGKSNGMSPHFARIVARYRRVALRCPATRKSMLTSLEMVPMPLFSAPIETDVLLFAFSRTARLRQKIRQKLPSDFWKI